ncbi:MAG: hypothetical protein L0Y58_26180 [Verrucomicrobia subdivision 3 bacterium]|nr:hypothetical protein [Limisphaerales bacterium]
MKPALSQDAGHLLVLDIGIFLADLAFAVQIDARDAGVVEHGDLRRIALPSSGR